jgi:oxygen-independent coproporphyrinogen-3 oxidase
VYKAYHLIQEMGFKNVNVDMMFALPGQTEAELLKDLDEALALKPDHISTYCLTFEEDTALWVKLSEGRVKLDPEHEAKLYEATWKKLEDAGYVQYEISNFAKPGYECRHNLSVWKMQEWIGLGPSAASQHDGVRGVNPSDLDLWNQHIKSGQRMQQDRRILTADLLIEDLLIFGLRMNQGVDITQARLRFPNIKWNAVEEKLKALEEEGLLVLTSHSAKLTAKGRLLADSVGNELVGVA